LLGRAHTREVRGQVDRLFDSSGKASLTLNVDEFTLAVSLRTGIYVFEAEDVFRWLRYFRDENFFGDQAKEPSHPDNVRDLRRARAAARPARGERGRRSGRAEASLPRRGGEKRGRFLRARADRIDERAVAEPPLARHQGADPRRARGRRAPELAPRHGRRDDL